MHVTQLIIYVSHFVRVARRSNSGLQPYRLSALVHIWNAERHRTRQNHLELVSEISAPFSRCTQESSC